MEAQSKRKLFVYTDGGARGNPGPAAIGVYIIDDGSKHLFSISKKIGYATNNVAEYTAVLEGLKWILEHKNTTEHFSEICFFLDSLLVVSQLNGVYKVKDNSLRDLFFQVRTKEQEVKQKITYSYIPREKNKKADYLVNLALDKLN